MSRGGGKYLTGAALIALSVIMLLPLLASIMASLKTTAEAAAVPPTYWPSSLSLDSYFKLWVYQAGLPVYLANSLITALLSIILSVLLTVPAGYALARFPSRARKRCSSSCCWR